VPIAQLLGMGIYHDLASHGTAEALNGDVLTGAYKKVFSIEHSDKRPHGTYE
jgi:hypothetical protein